MLEKSACEGEVEMFKTLKRSTAFLWGNLGHCPNCVRKAFAMRGWNLLTNAVCIQAVKLSLVGRFVVRTGGAARA